MGFVRGLTRIILGVCPWLLWGQVFLSATRGKDNTLFEEKAAHVVLPPFPPNAQLLCPHYNDRLKGLEDPNTVTLSCAVKAELVVKCSLKPKSIAIR